MNYTFKLKNFHPNLILSFLLILPLYSVAQFTSTKDDVVDSKINEIVIKLDDNTSSGVSLEGAKFSQQELNRVCEKFGDFSVKLLHSASYTPERSVINRPNVANYAVVRFDELIDIKVLTDELNELSTVAHAEPNGLMYGTGKTIDDNMKAAGISPPPALFTPNDQFYWLQYWAYNDGTFPQAGQIADNAPDYFPDCTVDADIDLQEAWDLTTGSNNVTLAILDTGMKIDHPDMQGRIVGQKDFVNNDNDATDDNGHGTNCGGIFFATGNNNGLHAGVNWGSPALIAKVLGANNSGQWTDLADGIIWAVDNGADVISMSIGGQGAPQALADAVQYAYSNNVVLIAASGNSNANTPSFPSSYPQVISVGATTCNDHRVNNNIWGSNYHSTIDLVAPGSYIYGLNSDNNDSGRWYGGTSMACPMVSGAVSLMLSLNPNLTVEEVRTILRYTAEDQVGNPSEDTPGFDIYYGDGRLNVRAALESASENCNLGAACDDGDPCTTGTTFQQFCFCGGGTFLPDADNDGVCDIEDECSTLDDTLLGQPCDDGDACTSGETWSAVTCSCTGGVYVDEDLDGICAPLDPDDTWACVPNQNHPLCAIDNCGIYSYEDFEDGDYLDNPFLWNVAPLVSWPGYCMSGQCSYMVNDDKLSSAPLSLGGNQEALLSFYGKNDNSTWYAPMDVKASLDNGNTFILIETFNYGTDFNENSFSKMTANIPNQFMVDGVILRIEQQYTNGFRINIDNILLEVCVDGGGGCVDGDPCNDGNPCTTNDTLDVGCNCTGVFQDSDNDGVCDTNDICQGGNDNIDTDNDGIPDFCDDNGGCNQVGDPCNDGNPCTANDVFDVNCNCAGVLRDADNDGVCDDNDICQGGDDNIDSDNDGIPDFCDTPGVDECETDIIEMGEIEGDLKLSGSCYGLILESEDGSCYKITVLNGGQLKSTPVNCNN